MKSLRERFHYEAWEEISIFTIALASAVTVLGTPPAVAATDNNAVQVSNEISEDFVISVDLDQANERNVFTGDLRNILQTQMTSTQASSGSSSVTCAGSYDYPHASSSSNRSKVNAHITVKCFGTLASSVTVKVQSQMLDSAGRRGSVSTRTGNGAYGVKVGGDLACTTDRRMYQALGDVYIYYPVAFQRSFDSRQIVSKAFYFKKVDGKCVKS